MPDNTIDYQRVLLSLWWRLESKGQLWMSDDHILAVSKSFLSEEYRRFYFAEIKSIIYRRTWRRLWLSLIIFALVGFSILFTLGSLRLLFPCVLGVILVANIMRGPGCTLFITTATGRQRVKCVRRVYQANEIMKVIDPLIIQAQHDIAETPQAEKPQHTDEEAAPSEQMISETLES